MYSRTMVYCKQLTAIVLIQFVIILSIGNVTISEAITGVASITVDRTTGMSYNVKSTPFFYKNHVLVGIMNTLV